MKTTAVHGTNYAHANSLASTSSERADRRGRCTQEGGARTEEKEADSLVENSIVRTVLPGRRCYILTLVLYTSPETQRPCEKQPFCSPVTSGITLAPMATSGCRLAIAWKRWEEKSINGNSTIEELRLTRDTAPLRGRAMLLSGAVKYYIGATGNI